MFSSQEKRRLERPCAYRLVFYSILVLKKSRAFYQEQHKKTRWLNQVSPNIEMIYIVMKSKCLVPSYFILLMWRRTVAVNACQVCDLYISSHIRILSSRFWAKGSFRYSRKTSGSLHSSCLLIEKWSKLYGLKYWRNWGHNLWWKSFFCV